MKLKFTWNSNVEVNSENQYNSQLEGSLPEQLISAENFMMLDKEIVSVCGN